MWQGYEDTHKIRGDEGPGSCPPRWAECKASSHWLWKTDHTQLFPSPVMLQTGPSFPEQVVVMEQHSTDEEPAEGLSEGTPGEKSTLWLYGGKKKQAQRPWSRICGKPRKTKRCVFRWEQNFVLELLSRLPIVQNEHRTSKQDKERHRELYSIECGHHSLIPGKEGPVVVLWFLNCVLFIVSILSQKKKVERLFWFLGNLQKPQNSPTKICTHSL